MKREIERWRYCDPKAMAFDQSRPTILFALQDAKADILELHAELLRAKSILSAIGYPRRGTFEEVLSRQDMADISQAAYTLEDMRVLREIDPVAVRIPPGVRKIVDAVMAIEREECAKVCEALSESHKRNTNGECDESCEIVTAFEACAEAIRAMNNREG